MFNEEEFIKARKEDLEWWNSKKGTTVEFSMGYDSDLQRKMEILESMNNDIKGGLWVVFNCKTCSGHSQGERPIHAMIWKTEDYTYDA